MTRLSGVKSFKMATSAGLMQQLDNYIIVDIGANLTNKKFSRDLDSVLKRAKEAGTYQPSTINRIPLTNVVQLLSNKVQKINDTLLNSRSFEDHGDRDFPARLQGRAETRQAQPWRPVQHCRHPPARRQVLGGRRDPGPAEGVPQVSRVRRGRGVRPRLQPQLFPSRDAARSL